MNQRRGRDNKMVLAAALAMVIVLAWVPANALAIGPGAKGPDVHAVQGMLKSLGYYAGEIDGIYEPF